MAYQGFKKLKESLSKEKDIKNPGAVAAEIGMKKYGKKKFEKAAHNHTPLEHSKPKTRSPYGM